MKAVNTMPHGAIGGTRRYPRCVSAWARLHKVLVRMLEPCPPSGDDLLRQGERVEPVAPGVDSPGMESWQGAAGRQILKLRDPAVFADFSSRPNGARSHGDALTADAGFAGRRSSG